jgi:hypothetical protein
MKYIEPLKSLTGAVLALGCAFVPFSAAFAQATPPKPADQVPVVDPFARNVNRPVQYGAVPSPKPRDERKPFAGNLEAQYHYEDDMTRLPDLRNYRVISISTRPIASKPIILGPDLKYPGVGAAPRKAYLRIYSHATLAQARQFVFDFYESNKKMIDANFVIRKDKEDGKPVFRVDLGPFANERHANMFCTHVLGDKTKNILSSCMTIVEYPAIGEKSAFQGSATVGLSASMVQNIANTNKGLPAGRLFSAGFDLAEGDTLGRNDFVVIKVSQRGVHLAGESGRVFLLPADIIPLPTSADEVEE